MTRRVIALVVLGAIAVALVALRFAIYRSVNGELTMSWPDDAVQSLRLTAVTAALVVGAALAISGLFLQVLLRNPLASPFVLGLSSGAALGVMMTIWLGATFGGVMAAFTARMASHHYAVPATAGALLTLVCVYTLGQRRHQLDPLALVLVGVVVSAICGALILFMHHLVPYGLRGDLTTWMSGSIRQGTSAGLLLAGSFVVLVAFIIALVLGRAMDAAMLGDEEARSVGLAVGRLRVALFIIAGVLAALAVALAGPVAFVGLIAPHAARLIVGPRHRALVVGSTLCGVILLVGADIATQVLPVQGGRIPVGVFTALIGGPAFIWLLRSGRGVA